MKALKAHLKLIDCGRASKRTRGTLSGGFFEASTPPFSWWI